MISDEDRAAEDAADEHTRNALERHVAMRLSSIIRAEEESKRRQRNTILILVCSFVVITLAAIVFLMVQMQAQADRIEAEAVASKRASYDVCRARNDQSERVARLLTQSEADVDKNPLLTSAQKKKQKGNIKQFMAAFPVVNCTPLLPRGDRPPAH